jgi:hypothetical protein
MKKEEEKIAVLAGMERRTSFNLFSYRLGSVALFMIYLTLRSHFVCGIFVCLDCVS